MRRTNFTQQLIRKKVYGAKSNANISALSAKKHLSYHTLSGHTNSAAHMKKAEWQFHGSTVGSTPSALASSKAAPKEPNCPPCVLLWRVWWQRHAYLDAGRLGED